MTAENRAGADDIECYRRLADEVLRGMFEERLRDSTFSWETEPERVGEYLVYRDARFRAFAEGPRKRAVIAPGWIAVPYDAIADTVARMAVDPDRSGFDPLGEAPAPKGDRLTREEFERRLWLTLDYRIWIIPLAYWLSELIGPEDGWLVDADTGRLVEPFRRSVDVLPSQDFVRFEVVFHADMSFDVYKVPRSVVDRDDDPDLWEEVDPEIERVAEWATRSPILDLMQDAEG